MSAYEALLNELARQPDSVARKLLDYLHVVAPATTPQPSGEPRETGGYFSSYWGHFYGAFDGEEWEESRELPYEKREEW